MFTEMTFKAPNVLAQFQEYLTSVTFTKCPDGRLICAYRYTMENVQGSVEFRLTRNGSWFAEVEMFEGVANAERIVDYIMYGNTFESTNRKAILKEYGYRIYGVEVPAEEMKAIMERYLEVAPKCILHM